MKKYITKVVIKNTTLIDTMGSMMYVYLPSTGHIVKDTLSISDSLMSHSFSHIRRQDNVITHDLTNRARLSFSVLAWMEFVSLNFLFSVVSDLSVS